MSIQKILSDANVVTFRKHGDNFRGAGYTKSRDDADRCYSVMLDVVRPSDLPVTVVDLGCGLAHFLEFLQRHGATNIDYTGIDLSAEYLAACRAKFPSSNFVQADVLSDPASLPASDYIIMNGLFNYRGSLPRPQMMEYYKALLSVAFSRCRKGIAFNVMSKLVDWERDDLFHASFEETSEFVWRHLSRHFSMRQDYGMYEYTTYVYKDPLPQP
jgi:SAM-dependent methyltransferase